MTDEEKEALEILNNTEWDGFMIIIKNLIEKQSKIISKLYKSLENEIGTIVNLGILLDENARKKEMFQNI